MRMPPEDDEELSPDPWVGASDSARPRSNDRRLCSAPEDHWWHYVSAVAAILSIVALSFVGLRAVQPDCVWECSTTDKDRP